MSLDGHGQVIGRRRPDFELPVDHPGYEPVAELACDQCRATWTGEVGMECPWCERSRELLVRWQRELLLGPELPEPCDRRFDGAMRGWARRLANGVKAGIVSELEADRAWRREVRRASA